MDADHIDELIEYFRESSSDSVQEALDELGRDFSEEEVRLLRIKFISEMGN
jgi:ATP-dependent DNA helicase RecQ